MKQKIFTTLEESEFEKINRIPISICGIIDCGEIKCDTCPLYSVRSAYSEAIQAVREVAQEMRRVG